MRYYSSTAGAMSLTGGISNSDTSITLDTVVGLPSSFPYSLVLDPGEATEEIVQVTSAAGSTLVVQRGYDGTSAQSHSLGATVRHMMIPQDLREPQQHIAATTGVHGLSGALVGTDDVQSLKNKTAEAASAATPGLVVKGAVGQTEDYLRVESNAGTMAFESSPSVSLSTGPVELHNAGGAGLFKRALRATASAVDVVAGVFKAAAGQTADILQIRDSADTVVAKFNKDGNLTAPSVTATGALSAGAASVSSLTASGAVSGATVSATTADFSGGVAVGSLTSTEQPEWHLKRQTSDLAHNTEAIGYVQGGTGSAFSVIVSRDGAQVNQLILREDGRATVNGRFIPITETGTSATLPIVTAGSFHSFSVTFPAGKFSAAPGVSPTPSTARLTAAARNITTSGCTIEVANWSSASTGSSEYVTWTATQE